MDVDIFQYIDFSFLVSVCLSIGFIWLLYTYWRESKQNLPPRVNYFVSLFRTFRYGTEIHLSLIKMAEMYGNVFTSSTFTTRSITLNGFDAIKEAFLKCGDIYHGKPKSFGLPGWFTDYLGVLNEDGHLWREQRRFLLSNLRDLGFGKNSMAERIQVEAKKIVEVFLAEKGEPFEPVQTFSSSATNIISSLVFGEQFSYDDPELQKLQKTFDITNIPKRIFLLILCPWLRFLPFFNSLFGWNKLVDMKNTINDFVNKRIEQHKETLDKENPRDLTDAYLIEAQKAEADTWMTDARLCANIGVLFNAGLSTSTGAITWAIKLMPVYPEIQQKIHKELDDVVGQERIPLWSDRSNLPFTEATLMEVLRFSSLIPINVLHRTTRESTLYGYTIPQDCLVTTNLYSALYDPKHWENPHKFFPERFLDEEGKLIKKEAFIPFSIGKRTCLGESLARMELFQFFTILLQRFKFQLPDGVIIRKEDLKVSMNFGEDPLKFKLCALPRF